MSQQWRDLAAALAILGAGMAILIIIGLIFNLPTLL